MPTESLEVVRRGIAAFNGRDVDAFAALVSEDFEWGSALSDAVGTGVYEGRAGVERYFRESAETWECLAVECEELLDLGADGVLMLGRAVGRGVGSGARVDMPLAFLAMFSGERIGRVRTFSTHEEARDAVGQRARPR